MKPRALIGFDGFVDRIQAVVKTRTSPDQYVAFRSLTDYVRRLDSAIGRKTNIEVVDLQEKVGGNGPIMAFAMSGLEVEVCCIGTLSAGEAEQMPAPVFAELSERCELISVGRHARSSALEFPDGKIIQNELESLNSLSWSDIVAAVGGDRLRARIASSDLVALVNWTMIPKSNGTFTDMPALIKAHASRRACVFVDLADPAKKPSGDLNELLAILRSMAGHQRVALGLNMSEAEQVAARLHLNIEADRSQESWRLMLTTMASRIGLHMVVVHNARVSMALRRHTAGDSISSIEWAWVPTCNQPAPRVLTGAGDTFNAGFCTSLLMGESLKVCVQAGNSAAYDYITTGTHT